MRRTRNADEFLINYQATERNYEEFFGPRLKALREEYDTKPVKPEIDENLEAHIRAYKINSFLAALNWRQDLDTTSNLPNIYPEIPIRSRSRKTRRFLDYLGIEQGHQRPLLIVEAKRPKTTLPSRIFDASYSETIAKGLRGVVLNSEWDSWLKDLQDYFVSTQSNSGLLPKRVIITNGDWLVIFSNPENAFSQRQPAEVSQILVFESSRKICDRFTEVFSELEYKNVLGQVPPLTPGELAFHLSDNSCVAFMHGIKLQYISETGVYQSSPVIRVAPVGLLRTTSQQWVTVEVPPDDFLIPSDPDGLGRHLSQISEKAAARLTEINSQLKSCLTPTSVAQHFLDIEGFDLLPAISAIGYDKYLVITGTKTHYLQTQASIPNCQFHNWALARHAGLSALEEPIGRRSVSPRSFFLSEELHHCAHAQVSASKASQITDENKSRCGSRSGRVGQAFCEIWRFEEFLCCRTCVFEEVCTSAESFRLPCQATSTSANTTALPN